MIPRISTDEMSFDTFTQIKNLFESTTDCTALVLKWVPFIEDSEEVWLDDDPITVLSCIWRYWWADLSAYLVGPRDHGLGRVADFSLAQWGHVRWKSLRRVVTNEKKVHEWTYADHQQLLLGLRECVDWMAYPSLAEQGEEGPLAENMQQFIGEARFLLLMSQGVLAAHSQKAIWIQEAPPRYHLIFHSIYGRDVMKALLLLERWADAPLRTCPTPFETDFPPDSLSMLWKDVLNNPGGGFVVSSHLIWADYMLMDKARGLASGLDAGFVACPHFRIRYQALRRLTGDAVKESLDQALPPFGRCLTRLAELEVQSFDEIRGDGLIGPLFGVYFKVEEGAALFKCLRPSDLRAT